MTTRHRGHVLVTGAAGGLGRAIAEHFALRWQRVTAVDQRPAGGTPTGRRASTKGKPPMSWIIGDLADAEFAESVVARAWRQSGPVDVAVTAAGIYPAVSLLDTSAASWDRVQAVNLRSVMQITRELAVLAITNRRRAAVVHISSGAAQRARAGAAAYSASKAGLEALTRAAALEFGPHGIRVNAVSPGFVNVASSVNPVSDEYAARLSENPLGRPGRPDDIARAVEWLASEDADWVNGSVLRVDGGASAGALQLPLHWSGPTALQLPLADDEGADDA